jgi:crossover junction endodeoxyribonuclease RuvC
MVILGIDPGSTRIGYGILRSLAGQGEKKFELVAYGTIEVQRTSTEKLLLEISRKIADLLLTHKPTAVGIEKLYFSKNVKTGIEVAHARGAILSEIAKHRIPIYELNPSEIKLSVTGYGAADKKTVAKLAAQILGIGPLKGFDDASDAVATALTAAAHMRNSHLK